MESVMRLVNRLKAPGVGAILLHGGAVGLGSAVCAAGPKTAVGMGVRWGATDTRARAASENEYMAEAAARARSRPGPLRPAAARAAGL